MNSCDAIGPKSNGRLLGCLAGVCLAFVAPASAFGQVNAPPVELDPVVVSANRTRESAFDAPAAIDAVARATIESGGAGVNLSEALRGVPGIAVLNRNNYAQDLQLSIRGFGARSSFGIRGVRLIVDGIPATTPDGQGQASSIDLSSAARIEVLRGPLAQLYGNAAGGVVQVFTDDDALVPTAGAAAAGGSFGTWKASTRFSTGTPSWGLTASASWFRTDGWREHSAAERGQLNARWQSDLTRDVHVSVVVNALDQPRALDPAGLTRAQWQADPKQVVPIVVQQDARKAVHQEQIGSVVDWRIDAATTATVRGYLGDRTLNNALSTPPSAQVAPTSSGGIVVFDRTFGGGGLVVAHRVRLDDARSLRIVGGVEADRLYENRQGYVDVGGSRGALKRDERNVVDDVDEFAQVAWDFARAWTLTAGARHSSVRFSSDDRFVTPTNPNDSGRVGYAATNPVGGLAWRPIESVNVYANVGRGFETPTLTELAYRDNASGLNFGLGASHSRHAEAGVKWKLADTARLDLAVFDIATTDEIVVDSNSGGRTTYRNGGRTTRRGVELGYVGRVGEAWRVSASVTTLAARFRDGYTSGTGASAVTVAAGNRLPGAPEKSAYAELAWQPQGFWRGFDAAVEVAYTGRIEASDANDDAANPATVFALRAAYTRDLGAWKVSALARLDNALDRRYAGSVIVNDSNQRYFEPALPRRFLISLQASRRFGVSE